MEEAEAYINLKYHKKELPNKTPCCLINPSKSSIGRISKQILDKLNKKVVSTLNLNQWKNTSSVLEWFEKIDNKSYGSFMQFDIEGFYPSKKSYYKKQYDLQKKL